MQHLPLWFPGAGFKRKAIQWKAKMEEFVDRPYELVKQRMVLVSSLNMSSKANVHTSATERPYRVS